MPLKLYKMDLSPPACAAMMICEIHNVPIEMIELNLIEKEHLKPEYVKKNPLHTVPMLEDDDSFFIHDSHVILTYLTDKYGKDDSLYPKDLKKRALVDQKIYFDVLFFNNVRNVTYPAFFEGERVVPEKKLNVIRETYDFLETFLTDTKFVAANNMTIADVSLVATVAAARYIVPIDAKNCMDRGPDEPRRSMQLDRNIDINKKLSRYPKILDWFSYMEKQPFYQKRTAAGNAILKEALQKVLDL